MRPDGREYLPTAGLTIRRKVAKMGKSSFGVALPKWWIQMYGLDKDGQVSLRIARESRVAVEGEKRAVLDASDNIQIIVTAAPKEK